jgi:hypothetical protein
VLDWDAFGGAVASGPVGELDACPAPARLDAASGVADEGSSGG